MSSLLYGQPRVPSIPTFCRLGLPNHLVSPGVYLCRVSVTLPGASQIDSTFCPFSVWAVALLNGVSLPSAETRADRSKKLFRHYTVGSYDSFDAAR